MLVSLPKWWHHWESRCWLAIYRTIVFLCSFWRLCAGVFCFLPPADVRLSTQCLSVLMLLWWWWRQLPRIVPGRSCTTSDVASAISSSTYNPLMQLLTIWPFTSTSLLLRMSLSRWQGWRSKWRGVDVATKCMVSQGAITQLLLKQPLLHGDRVLQIRTVRVHDVRKLLVSHSACCSRWAAMQWWPWLPLSFCRPETGVVVGAHFRRQRTRWRRRWRTATNSDCRCVAIATPRSSEFDIGQRGRSHTFLGVTKRRASNRPSPLGVTDATQSIQLASTRVDWRSANRSWSQSCTHARYSAHCLTDARLSKASLSALIA